MCKYLNEYYTCCCAEELSRYLLIMKCECLYCNRKISITALICKCGLQFCNSHIGDHYCSYDYVTENKKLLKKNLTKIKSERGLERI